MLPCFSVSQCDHPLIFLGPNLHVKASSNPHMADHGLVESMAFWQAASGDVAPWWQAKVVFPENAGITSIQFSVMGARSYEVKCIGWPIDQSQTNNGAYPLKETASTVMAYIFSKSDHYSI